VENPALRASGATMMNASTTIVTFAERRGKATCMMRQ
jgi:hypothetical protein